jgi:hypothetical protein
MSYTGFAIAMLGFIVLSELDRSLLFVRMDPVAVHDLGA